MNECPATAHPDVPCIPIGHLTPLCVYPNDTPLFAELDRDGMRNPILAYRVTEEYWRTQRPKMASKVPWSAVQTERGPEVWCVKFGNQRLAWARGRDFTHIAAVVVEDEGACFRWLLKYRDADSVAGGVEPG